MQLRPSRRCGAGARRSESLLADQRGQVLVIGVIVAVGLVMVAISVANVGMMVAEKIQVQDTVDAAAYSAATVEARYMNLSAYINRAIIANYDAMAFNTALWATSDAYDHGIASIVSTMYIIAFVIQVFPPLIPAGEALDQAANGIDRTVHKFFHTTTQKLNGWFDQTENDFNKYIEIYSTDVLSTIQGVLFAALQTSRYSVIQQVAKKIDPEVKTTTVLGYGAETVSADDLRQAVDWVIDDPSHRDQIPLLGTVNSKFNDMFGSDNDDDGDLGPGGPTADQVVFLGAIAEASLDKFAAGRRRDGTPNLLRSLNFADLIPGWIRTIIQVTIDIMCAAKCALSLGFSCDCDDSSSLIIGSQAIWGEEDKFSQTRVPAIARQRMREVNVFGIDLDFGDVLGPLSVIPGFGFPSRLGHTSGEKKAHIANIANMKDFVAFDSDRFNECISHSSKCNWNDMNITLSNFTGGLVGDICSAVTGSGMVDDHWDGTWDAMPTCGVRYTNFQICFADVIEYLGDVCSAGKFEQGVPRYDWRVDLQDVGFANYHYDTAGAAQRDPGSAGHAPFLLSGPSIAVVGVKPAAKVHNLHILGVDNTYPVSAIARSQVYYLNNPTRPDETPSLFNPHWVPRLAPLDSDDTPALLRRGLPYVMGFGVPITPTH